MRAAKASMEPETRRARAKAASLPETTAAPRMRSMTETRMPGRRYMREEP